MSNSPSNVDDDLTMDTFTEAFGIEPCEIGQIHNEVLLAGRDKTLELIKDNRAISSEDLERETLKAEMNYFVGLVNEKGRVKYHFDENKYDLLFSDNQQFVSLLDGEFEYQDILSSGAILGTITNSTIAYNKERANAAPTTGGWWYVLHDSDFCRLWIADFERRQIYTVEV